jgi:transcriptional regulator with XRE-family HTH domain
LAIKHFRKEAGLTQQQVWEATGIHYTEISRLERGLGNPTFSTLESLAEGLGVTIDRIFSLGQAYGERKKG